MGQVELYFKPIMTSIWYRAWTYFDKIASEYILSEYILVYGHHILYRHQMRYYPLLPCNKFGQNLATDWCTVNLTNLGLLFPIFGAL